MNNDRRTSNLIPTLIWGVVILLFLTIQAEGEASYELA